jgi:hypothetical protein
MITAGQLRAARGDQVRQQRGAGHRLRQQSRRRRSNLHPLVTDSAHVFRPDVLFDRLVDMTTRYGAYINFQQQLFAPAGAGSKRGLSVFVSATYADRRTRPSIAR